MLSNILGYFSKSSSLTGSLSDHTFSDLFKSHADLLEELFSPDTVLCCPVSGSLGEDLSKSILRAHVLKPDEVPGEFRNLKGQKVALHGNELICGEGLFLFRHHNDCAI